MGILRAATLDDAADGGGLLLSSMGEFGNKMFGAGNAFRAQANLTRLFAYPDGRFSYRLTTVYEEEGQAAGLLLCFPGAAMEALSAPLVRQFRQIYPVRELLRMLWLGWPLAFTGQETASDEFYIAHLAVSLNFRRRGIGQALLDHAEVLARKAGLRRCSLNVDLDNGSARRLYERQGYSLVSTRKLSPGVARKVGTPGQERRVKVLPPLAAVPPAEPSSAPAPERGESQN